MAVVQYSGLVNGMKGKLNGSVLSGAQSGFIIRSNRNHNKLCSVPWNLQKICLSQLSRSWRELTDTERTEWDNAAPNFPFTDKFGNSYTASGYQVYMSLNGKLKATEQSLLTEPPTPETVPDIGTVTAGVIPGPAIVLSWDTAFGADGVMQVFATTTQSRGLALRTGRMKKIKTFSDDMATSYNAQADYDTIFGSLISGGKVDFAVEVINKNTGQSDPLQFVSVSQGF